MTDDILEVVRQIVESQEDFGTTPKPLADGVSAMIAGADTGFMLVLNTLSREANTLERGILNNLTAFLLWVVKELPEEQRQQVLALLWDFTRKAPKYFPSERTDDDDLPF